MGFTKSDDEAVVYILVEVIERFAHIEQVTVHPLHAPQGLGRKLIDEVARWAVNRGLKGLTLTTFEEVPGTRRTTPSWDSNQCPSTSGPTVWVK